MKLRFSVWTMLIAGSLLSAPNSRAGQIPWSTPLERQTTENLNQKRYVAAGDRAYVVGVQDGSVPPSPGIGWHITGQMGGVWAGSGRSKLWTDGSIADLRQPRR